MKRSSLFERPLPYIIFLFILTAGCSLLAGCAPVVTSGKDFSSSVKNDLLLGRTPKGEVLSILGNPEGTETAVIDGNNHEIYSYIFSKGEFPNPPMIRMLQIEFRNNIVQGYAFLSAFPDDLTSFDERGIAKLVPNKTSKAEIISLFGPPNGKSLLPSARVNLKNNSDIGHATEFWNYIGTVLNEREKSYVFKRLTVFFDANGVMTKINVTIPEEKPSGPVLHSFVAFSDAEQCKDFGKLPLVSADSKILQFPFLIRLNDEGKVSKESYPATENEIDKYIHFALAEKYKLIVPNAQTPRVEEIGRLQQGVIGKVGARLDSPLEWGQAISDGLIENNTYIYVPIGIERESKHHINARFYILIIDSSGKVIFARCLPYNPNEWSADIATFERDVKGKLPLVD